MSYKIETTEHRNADMVRSNFIYNRFDLQDNNNFTVISYEDKTEKIYLQYKIVNEETAKIGISLAEIRPIVIRRIADYIFKVNKSIKTIEYSNSLSPLDKSVMGNYFRIELPNTIEEFEKRQTSKSRYNIKRNIRLLEEAYGESHFVHVDALSDSAKPFMDFYFENKLEGYGTDYKLDYLSYSAEYYTTNIYALMVNNNIVSMLMSCEQCPIVYLENLTYDNLYSKYSPGIVIYDYFLKKMISDKKKQVFLKGGDYEYKKRYGSVEEQIYDGIILRKIPRMTLLFRNKSKLLAQRIIPKKIYRLATRRIHKILHITER